jgi:hypothetical protein
MFNPGVALVAEEGHVSVQTGHDYANAATTRGREEAKEKTRIGRSKARWLTIR